MRLALDACRRTQAHPAGHRRNRRRRCRARGLLILKINRRQEMDLGLRGRAAVVSGSTAGIGLAIATTLAAEGAKVVVNGRTEARVATLSAPQSRNISRSRRTAFHANNETQIPAHCSGHCHGRSSGGREKISCDAQFHFINDAVLAALAENQPVSSVDTKKKELAVDPVVALGWSYVGPAKATHGRRRARRSRST